LGVLLTGSFLVLLLSIDDLRDTSQELARSEDRVTTASRALRRTVDLETGLRAYLLTSDRSYLEPTEQAQAELPAILRDLGDRRATAQAEAYQRYIAGQVEAGAGLSRGEAIDAVADGKARLDAVRSTFETLIDAELRRVDRLEREADATADRARIVGVVTFVLLLAAIPIALLYLLRVVVAPVSDVSRAAQRLASGDQDARAPEAGAGEVGALARSFNAMATALEVSRSELEARGIRLGDTNKQLREALREVERSKAQAILELSTPVLQLSRRRLVVPIIGAIDVDRARQFDDRLLHEVRAKRASVVVIDVTGVPEIDTPVAAQLQRTFAAIGLLGARVIVTGVSGELAEALVGLGVDFAGIQSFGDLQSGVETARGLAE
jgi:anti-anti-sigma regulatory factor/CHASE3 domain sensor protein